MDVISVYSTIIARQPEYAAMPAYESVGGMDESIESSLKKV